MAKQATAAAVSDGDDPTKVADKRTVQDYLDVPLGVADGPAKNVKTIGDLLESYTEIVKEHGRQSRELKALKTRVDEIDDKGGEGDKGGLRTELWDKAVSDQEEHGHITAETLALLEQASGIPANVFVVAAGVMLKADEAFGEKTKELLGVTTAEFQDLIEKAGYAPAYQAFMQDQVSAGRYGFLSDVVEDLKSKGVVDASKIGQKGDDEQAGGPNDPGRQSQQRKQVDMGVPPNPPAPDKGWESNDSFQNDFNEAKQAQQGGDPTKMTALEGRMATLETAGQEFYPGSPKGMALG